jgi:hypothetical protein
MPVAGNLYFSYHHDIVLIPAFGVNSASGGMYLYCHQKLRLSGYNVMQLTYLGTVNRRCVMGNKPLATMPGIWSSGWYPFICAGRFLSDTRWGVQSL